VFDTRNTEIGPHSGNWSDLLVQRAGKVLGGNQDFTRITGTVRQYVPLGEKFTLAERVVMQTVHGNPAISEIFTLQNARDFVTWAKGQSYINRLAFWSLARDNGGCAGAGFASPTCSGVAQSTWQFSSAFSPF